MNGIFEAKKKELARGPVSRARADVEFDEVDHCERRKLVLKAT